MLRRLITHPVTNTKAAAMPPVKSTGRLAGLAEATTNEAAFLTTDGLVSFSGASLAITTIWKVLKTVFDPGNGTGLFEYLVVPLILSLLWGVYNFYVGYTEENSNIKNGPELAKAIVIAFINSFLLAASVLGIESQI